MVMKIGFISNGEDGGCPFCKIIDSSLRILLLGLFCPPCNNHFLTKLHCQMMSKYFVVVTKKTYFHDSHLHDWYVEKFYLGWFGTKCGWPPNISKIKILYLVHFLNSYVSKRSYRGPSHAQNTYFELYIIWSVYNKLFQKWPYLK